MGDSAASEEAVDCASGTGVGFAGSWRFYNIPESQSRPSQREEGDVRDRIRGTNLGTRDT